MMNKNGVKNLVKQSLFALGRKKENWNKDITFGYVRNL